MKWTIKNNKSSINEALIYLGTGKWQENSIRFLEQLDLTLVIVGPEKPKFTTKKSTIYICADLQDESVIFEGIKSFKIVQIICDTAEAGVLTAAKLRERLNLYGMNSEVALAFRNKYLMRERLETVYPHIEFYSLAETPILDPNKTYVLKPKSSQGSQGVEIFQGQDMLESIVNRTKFSKSELMVESYLGDKEFTVDALILKNSIRFCLIGKKYKIPGLPTVASAILYETFNPHVELHKKLFDSMEKSLKALNFSSGAVHGEFVANNGIVSVVELAARGGGSNIYSIILPNMLGIDVFADQLKNTYGIKNKISKVDFDRNKFALLAFFHLPQGNFEGACESHSHKLENPDTYFLNLNVNEQIEPATIDANRHGFVCLFGDSKKILLEKLRYTEQENLCFIVNGEHFRPKFYEEKYD